jgi:hypothetical protein
MRKSLLLILCSLLTFAVLAQPQYYKGLGTSNSTFLLGNTAYASRTQMIFQPSDLGNPPAGTIQRIYFRYGSTGQTTGNTLTDFELRLLQTTAIAFPNTDNFFTGLTTVLTSPSYVIAPGTTGDWFAIELTNPFAYDPSQNLVVHTQMSASDNQVFGTYGTNNTGQKLVSPNLTDTVGSLTSSTWQDFGFDFLLNGIDPATAVIPEVRLFPNPANDRLTVSIAGTSGGGTLVVRDTQGREMFRKTIDSSGTIGINLSDWSSGSYWVIVETSAGHAYRQFLRQ